MVLTFDKKRPRAKRPAVRNIGGDRAALSPMLSSLVPDLQRLEARTPLTVAAIHRYVVKELAAGGDEGA